jgi:iron-sulfur cluster repair protein YtfE (RIC family)
MTPVRFNLYRDSHKGLRLVLSQLVTRAGQTDFHDVEGLEQLRSETQVAFNMLKTHSRHEEQFYGPLLEAYAPRIAAMVEADHEEHEAKMRELLGSLVAIDPRRAEASLRGHGFYMMLTRAVGEMLVHMSEEEQLAMPALWEKLSDQALQGVSGRLVASLSPSERPLWLRWMLPALNRSERMLLLARMRANMQEGAFDAVLKTVRDQLEERAYDVLLSDLRTVLSAA